MTISLPGVLNWARARAEETSRTRYSRARPQTQFKERPPPPSGTNQGRRGGGQAGARIADPVGPSPIDARSRTVHAPRRPSCPPARAAAAGAAAPPFAFGERGHRGSFFGSLVRVASRPQRLGPRRTRAALSVNYRRRLWARQLRECAAARVCMCVRAYPGVRVPWRRGSGLEKEGCRCRSRSPTARDLALPD